MRKIIDFLWKFFCVVFITFALPLILVIVFVAGGLGGVCIYIGDYIDWLRGELSND